MCFLRVAFIAAIACLPFHSAGQHVALHWYAFQSIVPLNAEEGKEALVIIRELTTDSISSFTDKSDQFKLATREEVNLDDLMDALDDSGYYLFDTTNPKIENQYYVRATKGYQFAVLYCMEPERFEVLNTSDIVLTQQAKMLFTPFQQEQISASGKFSIEQE